jgi:phosphoglycerate dehydrogenase-like enzyme
MIEAALAIPKRSIDLALVQQQLPDEINLHYWPDCHEWDEATYTKKLREVEVVIAHRNSPALPASLIEDPGHLRWLAYCAGTVKHLITEDHLRTGGIRVTNWGDNVYGVAESALLLILAGLKQLKELDIYIRNDWRGDQRVPSDVPGTLVNRNVGIYGLGPIGRHSAHILSGLGANIHFVDPFAEDYAAEYTRHASLLEMAHNVDVLTVHCGLNEHTRGTVNDAVFEALPQGAVVVNTARGPIIDDAALVRALRDKKVVAGLDVIEDEKTWPHGDLAGYPGVLFGGHMLSQTTTGPKASRVPKPFSLPDHLVKNLNRYVAQEPLEAEITADIFGRKT